MTADLVQALETAKFASREVYGVRRTDTKEVELYRNVFKFMILNVLGDPQCLEELSTTEINELTGTLILHT
jgi:hypothetical protein